MKRGITFLIIWLVTDNILGSVFVPAIPPGGVSFPYYLFVACVPVGAFVYARYVGRALVVVCYGLIAGAWFALPIFDDPRGVLAGATPIDSVALEVGVFALEMSLICSGAFAIGRRSFRRDKNLRSLSYWSHVSH
jgi:hypothetical protein